MSNPTELPDRLEALRVALKQISGTRFGWDGDCGVTSIADDALSADDEAGRRAQPEGEAPQAAFQKFDLTDYSRPSVYSNSATIAPAAQHAESGAQDKPLSAKTHDVVADLREYAGNPGYSHGDYADTMRQAAHTIEALRAQIYHWSPALAAQSQGAQPAELCIGFANNDQGVLVNVMQRHDDGTISVLHQSRVPSGDSFARFAFAAKAEAPAALDWPHAPGRDGAQDAPPNPAQQAAAPGALTLLNADELAALHRFQETCQDFDSGGYDVDKNMMKRLASIGVIESKGFNRYQFTEFGDYVVENQAPSAPGTPEAPIDAGIPASVRAEVPDEITRFSPDAWIRKSDITELTDSEPETGGWEPLYKVPRAAQLDGGQGEGK